ncbi:hypothetical protein HDU84_000763, partial [Entophlyctis sp. JEL0112]
TLCGTFDVSKYSLKNKSNNVLVDLSLDSVLIPPGDYIMEPNGCENLKIQGEAFPITPTSKLKRKSNPASPSTSWAKKTRVEALAAEDNESIASSETYGRSSKFREKILTRDNHCVVTRMYCSLEAVHIVSRSWYDVPGRRDKLPSEIREIISLHSDGIDTVRNGILLNLDLASAFNEGKFGFVFQGGHFYAIAITTDVLAWDGIQMDENLRIRFDGTCWWSLQNQPDARLLQFHFRNSVFKHLTGCGFMEEDSDSEYDRDEVFCGKQWPDSQHLVNDWRLDVDSQTSNAPIAQE